VGAVAALLMAGVLIYEQRVTRLLAQLVLLGMLAFFAFVATQQGGVLPHPEPSGSGLGLRGKPEQKKDGQKGGGGRSNNDEMEFRDRNDSDQQQTPVAVVLFHDDYSPPTGVYYFRQGAFSQFNGRRLVVSTRNDTDRDVAPGFSPTRTEVREVPEAGMDRTSLETTVALLADHTRPFALESPVSFTPAQNPNPDRFRRVYRAESVALTSTYASLLGLPAGHDDWSAEQRAHYREIPDDPRYAELGQKIMERVPEELREDVMLRAWSVRDWLSKEGIYSLRTKHSSAEDPTAHFLFGDKTGYCVHFAHAATYLMRSLGLPARVATGYAVQESARQGGSALLITSGNAHAWPEVYINGVAAAARSARARRAGPSVGRRPAAHLVRHALALAS